MGRPTLSVVIASQDASATVERCLAALLPQVADDTEVILIDNSTDGTAELVRQRHPRVLVVNERDGLLVPELWGVGILRSKGCIVALTTASFEPAGDWLAQIACVHREAFAGVGGAIVQAPSGSLCDLAVFLCRYWRYQPPFPAQRVRDFAGDNASYKRAALDTVESCWAEGFWEQNVHTALLDAGHELLLTPEIGVSHLSSFTFLGFIRQRLRHGLEFGRDRSRRMSAGRRALFALASPVIPLLYLLRITRSVIPRPGVRARFLWSLPVLMFFLTSWAVGECAGYLRGPKVSGRSPGRAAT